MNGIPEDKQFMRRTIELAQLAAHEGNLPVGAVITLNGKIVAEGRNTIWVPRFDATRHAEMEALRAVPPDLWNSPGELHLYTSLEPCLMCFSSILLHRIGRVVYGASDPHGGGSTIRSHLPHHFQKRFENMRWEGPIMPDECDPLLEQLLALEDPKKGKWG